LNRSVGHPRLYSEFSRRLDSIERAALLDELYFPYRDSIESWILRQVRRRRQVLHIGVHSFAARVEGKARTADIGLLYDPSRRSERAFCREWKALLKALDPALWVRRNYPYLGTADGLVTHLRTAFSERQYTGIELEVGQRLLASPGARRRITKAITDSCRSRLFEHLKGT
jgi:predicted N-formylglutamate amidohydrolase